MKIILATNFFKGSLSAIDAAETMKKAIKKVDSNIEVDLFPIADGGDGTLEAIKYCTKCEDKYSEVQGPLEKRVKANWLTLEKDNKKVAIIEGTQANGISLLKPEEYNPFKTTTFGIGELITKALDEKCEEIVVTIGGSSTNDGGAGILQALGAKLLDKSGNEIGFGGGPLAYLSKLDLSTLDERLKLTKLVVACDVDNPLCGPNGASAVYGPQKGASEEDVKILDSNLKNYAELAAKATGKDLKDFPGVGAAGGIGFAMKAILGADLIPGFDLVAGLSAMEEKVKTASLAITTEGRLDSQSLSGKAPWQVANMAKKYNIPTIVIAGSVERNLDLKAAGIKAAYSIADGPISLEDAMTNAAYLLESLTEQIINTIKITL